MNSEEKQEARYFPVSSTKLVVMSACTLGLYQIYWAWNCWEYVKARDDKRFNPAWRSVYVFSFFFNFLLFWDISREAGLSKPMSLARSVGLGFAYGGCWNLGTVLQDSRWSPTILLSFFVLIPVQAQINRINEFEAPGHDPNRRFSAANITAVVVGGLVLLLGLVSTFLGPHWDR